MYYSWQPLKYVLTIRVTNRPRPFSHSPNLLPLLPYPTNTIYRTSILLQIMGLTVQKYCFCILECRAPSIKLESYITTVPPPITHPFQGLIIRILDLFLCVYLILVYFVALLFIFGVQGKECNVILLSTLIELYILGFQDTIGVFLN